MWKDRDTKKIHDRYIRKSNYLMHYQLKGIKEDAMKVGVSSSLIFLLIAWIWGTYPTILASFDLGICILSLVYYTLIKQMMFKGKIIAYYRRSYRDMYVFQLIILGILISGAWIRTVVIYGVYYLNYYFEGANAIRKSNYLNDFIELATNEVGYLLALIIIMYAIYVLFYSEKYTTIKEYSNTVVKLIKDHNYTINTAINKFITHKDRQYYLSELEGIYYDEEGSNIKKYNDLKQEKGSSKISDSEVSAMKEIIPTNKQDNPNGLLEMKRIRRKGRGNEYDQVK